MAELTIGKRIADAAKALRAYADGGVKLTEGGLDIHYLLLDACESVDAAERLARAADALEAAYSGHGVNRSIDDHQAALGVFHEALAAWREVAG